MPRRVLQGTVVSDKMNKTVTVLVERRVLHPKYRKYVKKSSKYAAHDELNVCKAGDMVSIEECRPLSKNKNWKVVEGRDRLGKKLDIQPFDASTHVPVREEVKAKPVTKKAAKAAEAGKADKTTDAKPATEKKAPAKKPAAKSK